MAMPQIGIRFEPLKARLSKLQNSREYRDGFSKLKEEILGREEYKPSSKIESLNISKKVAEKYKQKDFSPYDVSIVEKLVLLFLQDETRRDRHRSSFFRLSPDMVGSHCKYIPLEQIKKILLERNINKYRILIPEVYSNFKDRWKLICLFDPNRPFSTGFDPFFREPQVTSWVGMPSDDEPYILDLRCDIRYPLTLLVRRFVEEIRFIKSIYKLKERRAGRYSEEEASEVRKFINDGQNLIRVFKTLHPEHKKFNYKKDYVENPRPTPKHKEAARLYKRVQRIVQTQKKENKTD
jgi:hypothetical protein